MSARRVPARRPGSKSSHRPTTSWWLRPGPTRPVLSRKPGSEENSVPGFLASESFRGFHRLAADESRQPQRLHFMSNSVGLGSWADAEYVGVLYDKGVAAARRLSAYSRIFPRVEVNSSYY